MTAASGTVVRMYRTLVGVGVVCGLLIVGAYELTGPAIAANKAEVLRHAIGVVLPGATSSVAFQQTADGRFEKSDAAAAGPLVYAGYDAQGALVGIAVEAQGIGYQDAIHVLYGYDPQAQEIVGFYVLESRETPGLGDRVESDPQFLANFSALDVTLGPDGKSLLHAIEGVKRGEKTEPWQIDAISGATVSSQAVTRIVAGSAQSVLPHLAAHKEDFLP